MRVHEERKKTEKSLLSNKKLDKLTDNWIEKYDIEIIASYDPPGGDLNWEIMNGNFSRFNL